jgi:ribose-phosphate pyrophosphokinase
MVMKVFYGNSNPALAQRICEVLGIEPGHAQVKRFSDGEIWVEIEENVRGKDVFVLQSICYPANENLMELLIMMDALKRASPRRITAVIPYYGYARQDRKSKPRTPISAKLVADLLTTAGANRILTIDLHSDQIQGFFNIPVDNLSALLVFMKYIKENIKDDLIIVSPDVGGVKRVNEYAERLNKQIAIVVKRRPAPNVSEAMYVVGDVKGKTAIIIDDIVDTAGTIKQAVQALLENGAKEVYAFCTHPVLSGNAYKNIEFSNIKELIVTDTIPLLKMSPKIKVISVAELLAEAIKRIHEEKSVSVLFKQV